mgnify:CR=1 FL=1
MIAGIDLGGTQVRVGLARSDGKVLRSVKTRTALLETPEGLVEWVATQIERLSGGEKVRSIGIGAPGPIDVHRGVLVNPPNLFGWKDLPLAAMLTRATGSPSHLENDANLAGLGEFRQGAGRGTRNLVYVTWSTGVGAGLILDGRLYSGSHGTAGEVGHMILDPAGPLDGCGQRGCLEAYAGGNMLAKRTGESAVEIFQAAAAGDQEARGIVITAATYMGQALVNLTNLFDPDMIVMGGGVTKSWAMVEPVLHKAIRASPFIKPARRPKLRRARLGDRAGTVGAVEWARTNL